MRCEGEVPVVTKPRRVRLNAAIFPFGYFIPQISGSRYPSGRAGSFVRLLPYRVSSCGLGEVRSWRHRTGLVPLFNATAPVSVRNPERMESFAMREPKRDNLRCLALESSSSLEHNGGGAG